MILSNVYLLNYYGSGSGNGSGYGNGSGSGYGSGNGSGNGNGNGNGNGYGDGDGYGDGYGSGNGSGNGNGNGYGDGDGYGDGYSSGNGDGYGDGSGSGSGSGSGYGDGYGDGDGKYLIKMFGEWFECSGDIENSLCHNLPPHLYTKITKEFISKVNNLESLRALREKIGLEKYIHLLDAKIIHEQTDNQGHKMKLYQYSEQSEKVILLEVICPSTGRMYHLYPPNQKAKDCYDAKASTFKKSIAYRHGDVGLFKVGSEGKITLPFSES